MKINKWIVALYAMWTLLIAFACIPLYGLIFLFVIGGSGPVYNIAVLSTTFVFFVLAEDVWEKTPSRLLKDIT